MPISYKSWEDMWTELNSHKFFPEISYFFVSEEVWEDMYKYGQVSESAEEKIAKQDLWWQKTLEKMEKEFDK